MSTKKSSKRYKNNHPIESVPEFLDFCFKEKLPGKNIDQMVKAVAHNTLVSSRPFQVYEMESADRLVIMMTDADYRHICVTGGIFHFQACYRHSEKYPATRVYQIKRELFDDVARLGIYLEKKDIKLSPLKVEDLLVLADEKGYPTRYEQFKERWQHKVSAFKGLAEGRKENTKISQSIWLESPGCIVCGGATDEMVTSTFASDQGLFIGMRFCEPHMREAFASKKTALAYVAEHWGMGESFLSKFNWKFHEHNELTIQLSAEAVAKELDCKILGIKDGVITAQRHSGFILKLRLGSLSDYGYNILSPSEERLARIDSANHHDVQYGPDHKHRSLKKKKKKEVEASFTTGFPVADIPAIRKMVEDAEAEYGREKVK